MQSRIARFPHHAWLSFWAGMHPSQPVLTFHGRHVTHRIGYLAVGAASVRWIHRGQEQRFDAPTGTVRYSPADGDEHTFIGTAQRPHGECRHFSLFIPQDAADESLASDGMDVLFCEGHTRVHNDAVLRSCLDRLAAPDASTDSNQEVRKDEAARQLLLRLSELNGGKRPAWQRDGSHFERSTLDDVVAYVDSHLQIAPSLHDMGIVTGLSPSHFAKKFRISTGISFHRFINMRRIQASLAMLKKDSPPVATIALELGFSHQSHFTRLFSNLTGMTPAKFRRETRRTVGLSRQPDAGSPLPSHRHGFRRAPR